MHDQPSNLRQTTLLKGLLQLLFEVQTSVSKQFQTGGVSVLRFKQHTGSVANSRISGCWDMRGER